MKNSPRNRGLTAILLTSDRPDRTVKFYEDVLGLQLEREEHDGPAHWACEANGIHFAIHNAKAFAKYTHPSNPQSNTTHLFFTIENLDEFQAHLRDLQLDPILPVEDVGPMKIVTVHDPDGRAVMFGTPWS